MNKVIILKLSVFLLLSTVFLVSGCSSQKQVDSQNVAISGELLKTQSNFETELNKYVKYRNINILMSKKINNNKSLLVYEENEKLNISYFALGKDGMIESSGSVSYELSTVKGTSAFTHGEAVGTLEAKYDEIPFILIFINDENLLKNAFKVKVKNNSGTEIEEKVNYKRILFIDDKKGYLKEEGSISYSPNIVVYDREGKEIFKD